jgi:hypothetical protein
MCRRFHLRHGDESEPRTSYAVDPQHGAVAPRGRTGVIYSRTKTPARPSCAWGLLSNDGGLLHVASQHRWVRRLFTKQVPGAPS